MLVYVFLDLDDTLFQTRRKCPETSQLHTAASGRDGSALSFMTQKQQDMLTWLGRDACLIPTTARNCDAFKRVALPFYGTAILDFGGVILTPEGELDPEWDSIMRKQTNEVSDDLHNFNQRIINAAKAANLQLRSRVISDFDMDLYVVTKQVDVESNDLKVLYDDVVKDFTDDRFYVHFNDNNLSVIPRFLNKQYAVKYLIDNHLGENGEEFITIGMGDSASDVDFMAACDYCITPQTSQIARALMEARNV